MNLEPIAISWSNLSYQVSSITKFKSTPKLILNQLNGSFRYGTLNSLMGPSGSGKTTLLNCLSGNVTSDLAFGLTSESAIYVNNFNEKSKVNSFFIEQHVHESICGKLTIKQIFKYAFTFKNGSKFSNEIDVHIAEVMQQLMLSKNILNRAFEKCSGGEKKRVAIGQELMAKERPELVFVDEPTTGLDSAAAFEMMNCLKRLTENGICVIVSIHQPNNEILKLFDCLYVLAKGGVCIYSGPPEKIEKCLDNVKLKEEQPPIEMLLKMACDGLTSSTVAQLAITTQQHVSSDLTTLSHKVTSALSHRKSFSTRDLLTHLHRQFQLTFIASYQIQLFFVLLYAINYGLVATVFSATSKEAGCVSFDLNASACALSFDEEIEFKENAFNLCYTVLYVGLVMIYSSTGVFASNVKCFRNEHRNKWYSLSVFFSSSVLISLLELTLFSLYISALAYFVTSQHAADDYAINVSRFSHFALFIWLLCLYVQSIGQLVGVLLIDYHDLAAIVSIIFYLCISMLNGFFVNTDISGNAFIITGTNLVALKFISQGIVYAIYGIDRCDDTEESVILQFLNVDVDTIWSDCWWVVANMAVFRVATVAVMFWKFGVVQRTLGKWAKSRKNLEKSVEIEHENSVKLEFSQGNLQKESTLQIKPQTADKIILGWRNLTLFASKSKISFVLKKPIGKILQNLNGHFRFGSLNALMGTSGAGKTSLLKVLNGQCKSRLCLESQFYTTKHSTIETCFLTQEVSGHLMPGLTVRQSILYASKLKNRDYYDQNEDLVVVDHDAIVLNLLTELGLTDVESTKVENCSGGERKRIALALELAARVMPNLICIDEPTSGLDSNSAEIVISCLQNLTREHDITIIASIHQPNSEMLHMFDQLYVLALGGTCIYSGPPQNIKAHLHSLSEELNHDRFPIEHLITLSCSGSQDSLVENLIKVHDQMELEETHQLLQQTQLTPKGLQPNRVQLSLHSLDILSQRYVHYFLGHHWMHWLFYFTNYISYALFLKLFFNFKMVQLDGCINVTSSVAIAQGRCGASEASIENLFLMMDNLRYTHFFSVFYLTFIYLQAAFDYQQELVYFVNEHRNGWYSTLTFYLVKSFTEIVPLLFLNLLYVYICNYYESIRPGIFWDIYLILTLASIGFQGIAHILALLTNGNISLLTILSITVSLFAVLLDDYLILHHRLHPIYQFLSNFSIPRFCYEMLILIQYGFGRCKQGQVQAMFYVMQINDDDIYYCLGMLGFNLILYRVIAVCLLLRKVNA